MRLFECSNYKVFVRHRLQNSASGGHGQYSRIAEHLGIHTSMVSQIFSGDKHLTFDQACRFCSYFGFSELESDYFIGLVQLDRAGYAEARAKCERELKRIRSKASSLKERLAQDVQLTEADNAVFYSHWYYTATKLMCSIPANHSAEMIARKLDVPIRLIHQALEFLLSKGLCVEVDGKIKPGPANTHLGADSPLVGRHHQNWRIKGFERMGDLKPSELFLTMPATLTANDALALRARIVEFVDEFVQTLDNSKGEVLQCLNIDWFNIEK